MLLMTDIKQAIRSKYAFPGGYALQIVMGDGEYLCLDCARKEFRMLCKARMNPQGYPDWRAGCRRLRISTLKENDHARNIERNDG